MNLDTRLDPETCLQQLLAGNRRFSLGAGVHPNQTLHRRDELLSEQYPLAVILGCADSRVPPEIIFDCGLGDLFVTRVIGHVADGPTLASIQFAVEQLNVKLILVLGHSECRAVATAVETQGKQLPGPFGALIAKIMPAAVTGCANRTGDPVSNSIIANIGLTVDRLREAEWAKGIMIRGAVFSLKSGLVTMDPELSLCGSS